MPSIPRAPACRPCLPSHPPSPWPNTERLVAFPGDRALLKMLRFYVLAVPVPRGQPRPTVSPSQHEIVLSFSTGAASSPTPSPPPEAVSNRQRRARSGPGQLLSVATDLIDNGLREYTRLLALCGRCRRPRTALYASAGGGGLSLFVECHSEGCGVTSEVSAEGGPRWLPRFARYVSRQEWEVSARGVPCSTGNPARDTTRSTSLLLLLLLLCWPGLEGRLCKRMVCDRVRGKRGNRLPEGGHTPETGSRAPISESWGRGLLELDSRALQCLWIHFSTSYQHICIQ